MANEQKQKFTYVMITLELPKRISNFKRTKLHQNSFKSLVKPTICLNSLVLSLILNKCLHFFNILTIFAAKL